MPKRQRSRLSPSWQPFEAVLTALDQLEFVSASGEPAKVESFPFGATMIAPGGIVVRRRPRPPARGTRGFEWLGALPSSTERKRSLTAGQVALELGDPSLESSIAARFSGELRWFVEHVGPRRGYRRNAAGDRVVAVR